MRGCRVALVGVWLAALCAGAGAQEAGRAAWSNGSEPLEIDSATLEARADEGLVVFQGEVVARQGDLTLHADELRVLVDKQSQEIRSVEAVGNVRIRKADLLATGERGSYEAATGVVKLYGEPKVWRGRDVVSGELITLYLAENRSVVEGARAVLFPGKAPEARP